MENKFKYGTSLYRWGDIKKCVNSLNVKLPSSLESKCEDNPILFVVYPGRAKQVNARLVLVLQTCTFSVLSKDTFGLVTDVHIPGQRPKPNRSVLL